LREGSFAGPGKSTALPEKTFSHAGNVTFTATQNADEFSPETGRSGYLAQ